MLSFTRKTASVPASEINTIEFLNDLDRGGFKPVIHKFKKGILDNLGLAPDPSLDKYLGSALATNLVLGEVFFPENGICCYIKISTGAPVDSSQNKSKSGKNDPFADPGKQDAEGNYHVELGELGPISSGEGTHLEKLCAATEGFIDAQFDWKDVVTEGQVIKGASIPTPSERDIELASILRDPRLFELLENLKEKDSIEVDLFLENSEQPEELEYFIDKLFEAAFLSEEIVIYDDQTSRPIIRAKDRASLKQLAMAGIKSPTGKPIEDLDAKRIAVISEDQSFKVNPSWVAKIFLTNTLFKVGLSNKDIQVLEENNDGAIIFANFDGNSVIFYLADNIPSEELTTACFEALDQLNNAHLVIFSEKDIGTDFVDELNSHISVSGVSILSNMDNMNADMAGLLEQQRVSAVKSVLEEINSVTSVDIAGLVISCFE